MENLLNIVRSWSISLEQVNSIGLLAANSDWELYRRDYGRTFHITESYQEQVEHFDYN